MRHLLVWLYQFSVAAGAGFLVTYGSMWLANKLIPPPAPHPPASLRIIMLMLGWQVATIVHELGHVCGARLAGFRPVEFYAGVLGFHWDGKWQFTFRPRAVLGGGHVRSFTERFEQYPTRSAVMVAGGPLASLVLSAAGLALCRGVTGRAQWQGYLAFFSLTLAGVSAFFVIQTLMPHRGKSGSLSDGARLLRLALGSAAAACDLLLSAFGACQVGTLRPRALPQSWIDRALSCRDRTRDLLYAQMIAYTAALDRGDLATANGHLQECLGMIALLEPKAHRNLYMDAAVMAAWYEQDVAKAQALLARAEGPGEGLQRWHHCYSEGAIALATGDPERALALAREGLEVLAGWRETGIRLMDREQLAQLLARAEAVLAAAGQVTTETTA